MIRVALVEDQTLVREGIRELLSTQPDIEVVGLAQDGPEALAVIPETRPDVAVLDIRLPGLSGIEVLRRLKRDGVAPPTILLTTFDDDEALLQGIRAGAKGYLLKDVSIERLAEAIRLVHAGQTFIRPAITERASAHMSETPAAFDGLDRPDPLTPREVEVLRMIGGGFSNREIADGIGCGEGTVKNHASSIFSKLGVRDRTRAVLKGIELGII